MNYELLKQLPLATSIVWFIIAFYQLYRRKTRTLTEISFLLGSVCFAGYAAADWLLFSSQNYETALFLATASVGLVTFAAFFFFLFTKLFLTRAHKTDVLLTLPLIVALGMVLDGLLVDLEGQVPWNWTVIYDPTLFLLWLSFITLYVSVATLYIYRTYKVVRESSRFLGWRMMGILMSFITALGLGLGTNAVFQILGIRMMPLFSTSLIIPGIMTLYVLIPFTKERISSVMRRWKSSRYDVLGAYIVYANGTLIASKTSYDDENVDHDIFSATLDAIQSFMKTSFPYLLGKSLKRIEHGDVEILIERGRYSYLALVIKGEDTDTLWIKMRELIENFEAANVTKLAEWNGIPDELALVNNTLASCFKTEALFS